ncbi:tRNA 2-selenouridine(34) synthase MnmH [Yoonia sediminilitoris]|uniref:tRNA 2-selenouridine synthase n=1 Tax=Yoonia sediminilitoris TaxID=1286148 RepID=A0A2T6KPF9_9RHOB|nr:tRNA 2-selenouridine(34) synthase MnmH [Yoonia sediminilitoris]PUB18447.1 tRNA 2-selenouridine synthase [Yoonia sediminilitoris]RCW98615.1 tRNA 2-selenouridine synthase [Yoonia sediminilitoris]
MPVTFDSLDAILNHGFDTVIDVRSPAEFAQDHIPGAINLPALDNGQRAKVGTIYKQISPFDGRKVGASMVIRNLADHISGPLADKDGAWRPLVYCWRGGQRSGVFATLLSEIGWRAQTINGGYTSFRRLVNKTLYDVPLPHRLVLLDGNTGTAKTDLLHRLAARGVQTLDLEGLAAHRGSLLGAMPSGQPAQKGFETALAVALNGCDPDRVVVVEAESSKIGKLILPPMLWTAMLAAPRVAMDVPLGARAQYLSRAYHDVIADTEKLAQRLAPLRWVRGHAIVDQWIALSQAGDLVGLSKALAQDHYDPAYAKSRRINEREVIATVSAATLDDQGQEAAADAIIAAIARL